MFTLFRTSNGTSVIRLVKDVLTYISTVEKNVYRVDCININDNLEFLEPLQFELGTGYLRCCLYNYGSSKVENKKQGYFPN